MANVKVYRFKKWLVAEERYVVSDRLATREMLAANPDLVLIPESEAEVDTRCSMGMGSFGISARWSFDVNQPFTERSGHHMFRLRGSHGDCND